MAHTDGRDGRLRAYNEKRSPERTPEPFDTGAVGGGIFVVQKHAATRLHYDLRLEHDGVLLSWAVPAGISFDPSVKRFAAHTEDHPIEYAGFEGVIPKGEYGGGEMVVWDRGALTWDEDPAAGLEQGKLLFSLHGYKLVGQWTLVRMRKDPKEWLLIKHTDAWSAPEDERDVSEASILSGLTVEDLRDPPDRATPIRRLLESGGATLDGADPTSIEVMLAESADAPFTDDTWLFEVKYDGYRMVAAKDGRSVRLRYRSGIDATSMFPDLVSALRRIPFDRFVIDGEVVVLDADGRPSFSGLQRRGMLRNRHEVTVASVRSPATFFGFDLLSFEDLDARPAPLVVRKDALERILPGLGPLRYTDHFVGIGEALYENVVAMGLEGIMAKQSDSRYAAGRSRTWLKIRAQHVDTFAVVGFTEPRGSRSGVGALHLGAFTDGVLSYAGRVGTGFSASLLSELRSRLEPWVIDVPSVDGDVPSGREHRWVEPSMQVDVRYTEVTADGSLRQPVFVSWSDLDLESVAELEPARADPPAPAIVDARSTDPTNPEKVFWPEEGYTKGDLIAYYAAVSDHLIPYLEDRPLVLDRYPDGIAGKSFFQKNAPDYVPDWIRTEWVGADDDRGNTYFVVEDADGLGYIANLASIPLHIWASRLSSIDQPDWCVLDLDPKEASFSNVVAIARAIKDVADAMEIPSYAKTSGKTGIHVLLPMGRAHSYDQQKMLGELVARTVEARHPDIATTVRNPAGRDGKVYIDFLQNGKGKLIVSPYSVRPVPGATVSAPLRWKEVTPSLDMSRFTIRSMPRRLATMKDDPMLPVLTEVPDIAAGLRRLAGEFPQ